MFVNGDDLLLGLFTKIAPNFIPKKIYNHIKHYHYDKSLNKENDIFDISEGRLEKFDFCSLKQNLTIGYFAFSKCRELTNVIFSPFI